MIMLIKTLLGKIGRRDYNSAGKKETPLRRVPGNLMGHTIPAQDSLSPLARLMSLRASTPDTPHVHALLLQIQHPPSREAGEAASHAEAKDRLLKQLRQ